MNGRSPYSCGRWPGGARYYFGWHGQTRLPVDLRIGKLDRVTTVRQVSFCRPANRESRANVWAVGFTLVELLVVISVVALLMAVLLPALAAARLQTRGLVCRSNVRQLMLANIGYASEHDGHFVPAASDMWDNAGRQRWHGRRASLSAPFDPNGSPLAGYLGQGNIKQCPAKVDFVSGEGWNTNFEQGCGGYGYNMMYLGSRLWDKCVGRAGQPGEAYRRTASICEVAAPAETLMFADTAISNDSEHLIEYSFAEPPFAIFAGEMLTDFYMSPSIHFRHRGLANVGWVDGHIDARYMAEFGGANVFGVRSADLNLGWFAPVDNTPFDLQ